MLEEHGLIGRFESGSLPGKEQRLIAIDPNLKGVQVRATLDGIFERPIAQQLENWFSKELLQPLFVETEQCLERVLWIDEDDSGFLWSRVKAFAELDRESR